MKSIFSDLDREDMITVMILISLTIIFLISGLVFALEDTMECKEKTGSYLKCEHEKNVIGDIP